MAVILLVEDEIADWEPLKMFLEFEGYIVDIVESAGQAEQALLQTGKAQTPYKFIITDMELCDRAGVKGADKEGGIQVVRAVLKQKTALPNAILVLSGRIDAEDKRHEKLRKMGITEKQILSKPVSPETIVEFIRKTARDTNADRTQ